MMLVPASPERVTTSKMVEVMEGWRKNGNTISARWMRRDWIKNSHQCCQKGQESLPSKTLTQGARRKEKGTKSALLLARVGSYG